MNETTKQTVTPDTTLTDHQFTNPIEALGDKEAKTGRMARLEAEGTQGEAEKSAVLAELDGMNDDYQRKVHEVFQSWIDEGKARVGWGKDCLQVMGILAQAAAGGKPKPTQKGIGLAMGYGNRPKGGTPRVGYLLMAIADEYEKILAAENPKLMAAIKQRTDDKTFIIEVEQRIPGMKAAIKRRADRGKARGAQKNPRKKKGAQPWTEAPAEPTGGESGAGNA